MIGFVDAGCVHVSPSLTFNHFPLTAEWVDSDFINSSLSIFHTALMSSQLLRKEFHFIFSKTLVRKSVVLSRVQENKFGGPGHMTAPMLSALPSRERSEKSHVNTFLGDFWRKKQMKFQDCKELHLPLLDFRGVNLSRLSWNLKVEAALSYPGRPG